MTECHLVLRFEGRKLVQGKIRIVIGTDSEWQDMKEALDARNFQYFGLGRVLCMCADWLTATELCFYFI